MELTHKRKIRGVRQCACRRSDTNLYCLGDDWTIIYGFKKLPESANTVNRIAKTQAKLLCRMATKNVVTLKRFCGIKSPRENTPKKVVSPRSNEEMKSKETFNSTAFYFKERFFKKPTLKPKITHTPLLVSRSFGLYSLWFAAMHYGRFIPKYWVLTKVHI